MDRKVEDREVLEVDYQPLSLEENWYCPFYFEDVDFNGEKELLINKWHTTGIKGGYSTYDIYKVKPELKKMTEPPFNEFNFLTDVNSVNKTITLYDGVWFQGVVHTVYTKDSTDKLLKDVVMK